MRITFEDFEVLTTVGSVAAVLNGEFEARKREGGQPGWYALHRVLPGGAVSDEVEANVYLSADGSAL